ncbi:OmpA family protein [Pseudopedobacter beijingensis]|uniref:OmpA family protein n=1 Tax=Pseudopedobacter beijingensis TaxID=1207056 RepID=A0ABW4I6S8_9SPHI
MRKIYLVLVIQLIANIVWGQTIKTEEKGQWQGGVFGGVNMPMGTYKSDLSRAKNGPVGGLFLDKYFKGNKFGIGLDLRFFQNNMAYNPDTIHFDNGYIAPTFVNGKKYNHFSAMLGPTYKASISKLDIEAFVRGGVLFQQFPEYYSDLTINNLPFFRLENTNNPKNNAKAWAGLGGVRFAYNINKSIAVFVQGDYLSTFSSSFGKDSGEFHYHKYEPIKPIQKSDVVVINPGHPSDIHTYFADVPKDYKNYTQTLNITAGVKFILGKGKKETVKKETPKAVVAPVPQSKDIVVVVKDKQTGIALSGVTVSIKSGMETYTSTTNANGEAERLQDAKRGSYEISGSKNAIATGNAKIVDADFNQTGNTIYREVFHDDPRFTLIGETIYLKDASKLAGVNTVLTKTEVNTNMNQTSDAEGKFIYQLDQQSDYTIVANQSGRFSQTENVTTKGLNRSQTLYVILKLGVDDIESGKTFVLKNINYDFDKVDIRPDAARILDNLVNIMKQNPSLKIELSSHTDSRGSDAYNLKLSQRRADAAVRYLVDKGIDRSRLVAKGFGETKLLNRCANGVECTEAEHEKNRRTEVKVLKYEVAPK